MYRLGMGRSDVSRAQLIHSPGKNPSKMINASDDQILDMSLKFVVLFCMIELVNTIRR